MLITSINPLRIFLYEDGLVRFASNEYSSDISKVHDVFTHLTNYSVNKKSTNYLSNDDSMLAQVMNTRMNNNLMGNYRDTSGL